MAKFEERERIEMIIKDFMDLSDNEKDILFHYILKHNPDYAKTYEETMKSYGSIVFDYGKSFFTLWLNDELKGTIAIVTKDVKNKGEAFITNINIADADNMPFLLDRAIKYASDFYPDVIKLGISPSKNHLVPQIESSGFQRAYEMLTLKYNVFNPDKEKKFPNLFFETLNESNKNAFLNVHNNAFMNTFNAAILTLEEVDELIDKNKDMPDLAGLCIYNGTAVGVYIFEINDNTGWIEAIGIVPDYQGKGLGEMLLRKSVYELYKKGLPEIKLLVVSKNVKAVSLYRKYGFQDDEVYSMWFAKDME